MPTATELRELDDEELENRLAEYRRELLNLRFQLATGQLDNITRLSQVRKDVARVLTVLRDREIALAEGRDAGPVIIDTPRRRQRLADEAELEAEVGTEEGDAPRARARRRRDGAGEGAEGGAVAEAEGDGDAGDDATAAVVDEDAPAGDGGVDEEDE
jgi:large subunit ribosomal protein L29